MQELDLPLPVGQLCPPCPGNRSCAHPNLLMLLPAPHFTPPKHKHMVTPLTSAGFGPAIKHSVFSSCGKNSLKKLCLNGVMKISATDPEVLSNSVMQGHF